MRSSFKAFAALACATALLAAAPGSASAGQCLYQSTPSTHANKGLLERSLLCLTNVYRLQNGRTALPRDTRLALAARRHSEDMVRRNYFNHYTPEGKSPQDRANEAGYTAGVGENIARTFGGTVLSLFQLWRASPGHNANMLHPSYVAAGFGISPAIMGTQMFGVGAANTRDTALDLYASSGKCAKAKLRLIALRKAVKRAREAGNRQRLRRKRAALREVRSLVRRICKPPPGG